MQNWIRYALLVYGFQTLCYLPWAERRAASSGLPEGVLGLVLGAAMGAILPALLVAALGRKKQSLPWSALGCIAIGFFAWLGVG